MLLALHSMADPVWRSRAVEPLCGTPARVHSIFGSFANNKELGMVAPLGTVYGPDTRAAHV